MSGPAQTCHTLAPRVTDLVPVGESLLCILQQSLFWSLAAQASITQVSSLKSQVIPFILSTVHTVHTLEPRVTVLVNVRPAQTCHTLAPRVTDLVPVGESLLSILQQSLFWSVTVQSLSLLHSHSHSHMSTHIHSLYQSWSCGHRLMVILTIYTHTLSSPSQHIPISSSISHSLQQQNEKQV